jgi:DNA-binding CsgD family transcriptional regulator
MGTYKQWTTKELRRLVELYNAGVPYKEIAAELSTTVSAVATKIYILRTEGKTGLRPNQHRPWTTEELQRLREMYTEGADPTDIAAAIGRTKGAVVQCAALNGWARGASKQKAWTYNEEYRLVQRWRQGATLGELAEEHGRSADAIKQRLIRLRRERGVEVVPYRQDPGRRGKA